MNADVVGQFLPADLFHHEPQQDGVGVRVLKPLAGGNTGRFCERVAQEFLWGEVDGTGRRRVPAGIPYTLA